jgi:hypothetical protein
MRKEISEIGAPYVEMEERNGRQLKGRRQHVFSHKDRRCQKGCVAAWHDEVTTNSATTDDERRESERHQSSAASEAEAIQARDDQVPAACVVVAVQQCCPKEEDRKGTTKEVTTGREGEKRRESKTCACEKQNERDEHRQRGHEKGSKSGGREREG